jgi:transposase
MIIRANILRLSDLGKSDRFIAQMLDINPATVARTRKKFVFYGLRYALEDRPHPGARRKLTVTQERLLIQMATQAPHWTLQHLTENFVHIAGVQSISPRTIQRTLQRAGISSLRKE